jgi:hypothetical protein
MFQLIGRHIWLGAVALVPVAWAAKFAGAVIA